MALFVAIALEPTGVDAIQRAIQEKFSGENLSIGPNAWIISATGIAKDVSDKLIGSPPAPDTPQLVVLAISGYFGLAPNTYWEWIASKMAATVHVR
jgi:hypothetical protein